MIVPGTNGYTGYMIKILRCFPLLLILCSTFMVSSAQQAIVAVENDANKNGIRDDVDVEIDLLIKGYSLTQPQINSVVQVARSYQYILSIRPNTKALALEVNKRDVAATNCAGDRLPPGMLDIVVARLESTTLHTQVNRSIYDTYVSLLDDENSSDTRVYGCEDQYTNQYTTGIQSTTPISGSRTMPCLVLTNFMERGSKVSQVIQLQSFLSLYGYMQVWPTGYFGPITEAAVKSFQSASGIDVRGWAGPATRGKVAEMTCNGDAVSISKAKRGVVVVYKALAVTPKKTTTVPVAGVEIPTTVIGSNSENSTVVTNKKLSSNSGTFYLGRSPVNSIYFSFLNSPYTETTYMCTDKSGETRCGAGQNFKEVSSIYDPSNYDAIPSGNKWLFTFYNSSDIKKVYLKSSINSAVEIFTLNYSNSQ